MLTGDGWICPVESCRCSTSLPLGRLPRIFNDGDEGVFYGGLAIFEMSALANLPRCSLGQDSPRVHDSYPVAVFGFFHKVGGHDHGHSLFGQRHDAPPKLAARQWIRTACRLVEKEYL